MRIKFQNQNGNQISALKGLRFEPKMGQLAENDTNLEFFQIKIHHKVLKSDLKKFRICAILGKIDRLWGQIFQLCLSQYHI